MMMDFNKYTVSGNEDNGVVLPNKLGLKTVEEINEVEFVGFTKAERLAIDELTVNTKFDLSYLYSIHGNALNSLYDFGGRLRTVNMSKDNFSFPPSNFLPQAMSYFEHDFLKPLLKDFAHSNDFLKLLARMHAELLFLHPFREGNGRTARLFTNMIYLSKTGNFLDFDSIIKINRELYISAVQQASRNEYDFMESLFIIMENSLSS